MFVFILPLFYLVYPHLDIAFLNMCGIVVFE
jgi:hypothetical protein